MCPIVKQEIVCMLNFALSKGIQKCNWKEEEEVCQKNIPDYKQEKIIFYIILS